MAERTKAHVHRYTGEEGRGDTTETVREIFFGTQAIQKELKDEKLSQDFIKRTLREHNLSKPHRKKEKGRSKYMLYPTGFLEAVGVIAAQIDFIGPRYIEGNPTPLHFISIRFIRPHKRQLFFRITKQTTSEVLRVLSTVFFAKGCPLPDVIQQDNDASFRGNITQKGVIGRYIKWLCHNGVISVFNAPRSPWNTGAVEGANSVFDKKFWTKFRFTSVEGVDTMLKLFNEEYDTYLHTDEPWPERPDPTDPVLVKHVNDLAGMKQPYLFLLRIIREDRYGKYTIEVLNRYITLPSVLKGQFVIVQIHIEDQWMMVWQERNDHTAIIRCRCRFVVSTRNYGRKKKE